MIKFNIKNLSKEQRQTRKRVLELSHRRNLSHLGSCLSSIDLIDAVYQVKSKDERFVLSNGHAGIALYVILGKNKLIKNPDAIEKLHVHPDRNSKLGIDVSSGSLGQGLPIALGIALSNRKKNTYCVISDGECAEGSIWESLRISRELKVSNLKILINVNGWGAYSMLSTKYLFDRLKGFIPDIQKVDGHNIAGIIDALKVKNKNGPTVIFAETKVDQLPFLKGLNAHYYIMNDKDYTQALKLLQ